MEPKAHRARSGDGTLGVIVAGGRGSRLGLGLPKALVRCGGATLLDRTLELARATCDEVVVAAPADLDLPIPSAIRIDDPMPAAGPLGGLVAGLLARKHERALVLAVDLPLVEPTLLAALLARLDGRSAVIPAPGGVPQPLAAAYASCAGPVLARRLEAGERSVIAATRSLDPALVSGDELDRIAGSAHALLNVNTAEDLATAERALAARAERA